MRCPRAHGLDCRQQWDELLALEFTDPRAGRVHFHTVACYQLQHPSAFPLTDQAREGWTRTVADVGPPDPEQHADRVTEWARSVLAEL